MSSELQATRNPVDADHAYAVIDERESDGNGCVVSATTVFLTASECPVGCNMCDLWRNTLTRPTPIGAIPRQIADALDRRPQADWIKLYNSGNFFDRHSIPPDDYAAIANLCRNHSRVIVENHPKFGRDRLKQFRDLVAGQLEVAVGLETVQPRWLGRLEKQITRDDVARYAKWLISEQVDLRVFLIVGVPGVTAGEAIRWARLSAKYARQLGARHISFIPARSGHGWNGRASELPSLGAHDLRQLQLATLDDVAGSCVVTIDLWDLETDNIGEVDQTVLLEIAASNLSQRAA